MDHIIRKANVNDYDQVINIIKEVHNLHYINRPDIYKKLNCPLDRGGFKKILENPFSDMLVVLNSNKEVVAYSVIKYIERKETSLTYKNNFLYVEDFAVKEIYRRKGIGKMFFSYIKQIAESKEIHEIQLNVWEFNIDAINFYNSLGMNTRNRYMQFII